MDMHQMEFCRELLENSPAAYLTTMDAEGFPQIRAMLNLRNINLYPRLAAFFKSRNNDLEILLSTNTSSVKVSEIIRDSKASVYYCIPERWKGLLFTGTIEIVCDPVLRKKLWQKGWDSYYPGGPDDPDYTILKLCVKKIKGYFNLKTFEQKADD